jgi:hypothetical protein
VVRRAGNLPVCVIEQDDGTELLKLDGQVVTA